MCTILPYNESEEWMYHKVYQFIWDYATQKGYKNTLIALPVVRSLHSGTYRGTKLAKDGSRHRRPYFCHSLSVCRMLINLQLPLSPDEEDIVLAAALCHDLKVYVPFPEKGMEMTTRYHMDPRIPEIMMLIYEGDCDSEEDLQAVFRRIRENKLALLVRLSDRGNIVEELYTVSIWKAHEQIHETRTYYIPMCIYAREHYPELDTPIGILHEKMRELIIAADIFFTRYVNREKELTDQILLLEEENARMRIQIRKKQEE